MKVAELNKPEADCGTQGKSVPPLGLDSSGSHSTQGTMTKRPVSGPRLIVGI